MSRELKRCFMSMALILSALFSGASCAVKTVEAEQTVESKQTVESEQVVRQLFLTHHDFEDWTFTPQANDKVLITNKSDIAHSIYITYPDGTVVNLDVQLPGETFTWTIPAAGEYLLQCWIHPIIREKMTVSP